MAKKTERELSHALHVAEQGLTAAMMLIKHLRNAPGLENALRDAILEAGQNRLKTVLDRVNPILEAALRRSMGVE